MVALSGHGKLLLQFSDGTTGNKHQEKDIYNHADSSGHMLRFATGANSERMRIDSSGKVIVKTNGIKP